MQETFNITPIVQIMIMAVTILCSAYLIPFIKSKISAEDFNRIQLMVKTAVEAAEQIYQQSGMGETKKQYVVQWLADRGIKLDPDAVDAIIESTVCELNNRKDDSNEQNSK